MTRKPVIPPNAYAEANGAESGPEGLPEGFVERLRRIVAPSDLEAAVQSFTRPKRTAFRVNTLAADTQSVLDELRAAGLAPDSLPHVPGARVVDHGQRQTLLESDAARGHRIYVQNPSSMIPPLALDPQPGDEVLDLAAAPGSKTHQMACLMDNRGRITAVESVRSRYYKLRDNMQALGAECVRPFFQDGTTTWRHRPEHFDRILLDAPCSSEGRFRADDPETTRYWSLRKVREMSRKQRRLLYSAIHCLRPGGRLVYSTCSFAPEENEVVIHRLLNKFSDALRIVPPEFDSPHLRSGLTTWDGREFASVLADTRRIVPDDVMDGFFFCILEKTASTRG